VLADDISLSIRFGGIERVEASAPADEEPF